MVGLAMLACAGQLALALYALRRRGALRAPLAALSFDLFAWQGASLWFDLSGWPAARRIDLCLSPLTTPLALEVLLAFTGQRRSLRAVRLAAWVLFGALALASATRFGGTPAWDAVHLALALPFMLLGVALLVRHRAATAEERARKRLLLLAAAVGTALGSTEMWSSLAPWIPSLGPLGFLAAAGLTSLAAARHHLLESDEQPGAAARKAHLAMMGHFSSQLAHDLRNPLAALRGAAQFLEEELRGQKHGELASLMVEQCDRMQRALEAYQRLAQVEAVRTPLAVNEVVRDVVSLQPFVDGRVSLRTELASDLPACAADRELLTAALENLVKNAFEATPSTVLVGTALEPHGIVVRVEDDGAGMDARRRERAFDEFFTTKAGGSGLGLSFVRRVAEAHGGEVSLASEEGRGTVVRLRLPL